MSRIIPIKRVLISVSNKKGLLEFAKSLTHLGIELVSTGGTQAYLQEAGIPVSDVTTLTGMPEMLGGRVKTLHSRLHAGILGLRDSHAAEAETHAIVWIDMVIVNLYPYQQQPSIENIDIGGPTLLRAAAKNHAWVAAVSHPTQYSALLAEIIEMGGLSDTTRRTLAASTFAHTAEYDLAIAANFSPVSLRYGENPQQTSQAFILPSSPAGILSTTQWQGKSMSYNNILDADAAIQCLYEFEEPTAVIIKHNTPCGIASADCIEQAFALAFAVDPVSAFGGIVALNRTCDATLATSFSEHFLEVIIAPAFSEGALSILQNKPNLRLLNLPPAPTARQELRSIQGGLLLQTADLSPLSIADLTPMTTLIPTTLQLEAMLFAWKVVKHLKSNAIAITDDHKILSIGAGQTSRIDAVTLALDKINDIPENAVLASDGFFPFADNIERIAKAGIKAIIQPGGSIKDAEVLAACNNNQIAMVFSNLRCFKH